MKRRYIKVTQVRRPRLTRMEKKERIERLAQEMGIKLEEGEKDERK